MADHTVRLSGLVVHVELKTGLDQLLEALRADQPVTAIELPDAIRWALRLGIPAALAELGQKKAALERGLAVGQMMPEIARAASHVLNKVPTEPSLVEGRLSPDAREDLGRTAGKRPKPKKVVTTRPESSFPRRPGR